MKSYYPGFYRNFRCKANQCQKTCCRHWEIDIDERTAKRYLQLDGELGRRIEEVIEGDGEVYSFRLQENGDCPFLAEGLCQIVLEKGESFLSDVCANHPRFFKYVEDTELCGLGLSCEAVSDLLGNVQEEVLSFFEEKNENVPISLADILKELELFFLANHLSYAPSPDVDYYSLLLDRFLELEFFKEEWRAELKSLRADIGQTVEKAKVYKNVYDKKLFNRIYQYILYRQIDMRQYHKEKAISDFAKDSTECVFILSACKGHVLTQLARWSDEIEYNEDNVENLLYAYDLCNDSYE